MKIYMQGKIIIKLTLQCQFSTKCVEFFEPWMNNKFWMLDFNQFFNNMLIVIFWFVTKVEDKLFVIVVSETEQFNFDRCWIISVKKWANEIILTEEFDFTVGCDFKYELLSLVLTENLWPECFR